VHHCWPTRATRHSHAGTRTISDGDLGSACVRTASARHDKQAMSGCYALMQAHTHEHAYTHTCRWSTILSHAACGAASARVDMAARLLWPACTGRSRSTKHSCARTLVCTATMLPLKSASKHRILLQPAKLPFLHGVASLHLCARLTNELCQLQIPALVSPSTHNLISHPKPQEAFRFARAAAPFLAPTLSLAISLLPT